MLNRILIMGRLTRDPELRNTPGGLAILRFGVAVNDRRKNAQGEWEDKPNYIDCVVFGKRAEALERRLSKGARVFVSGKLSYSSWEDRNGQKRSKIEIVANDVENSARESSQKNFDEKNSGNLWENDEKPMKNSSLYDDEDIPF